MRRTQAASPPPPEVTLNVEKREALLPLLYPNGQLGGLGLAGPPPCALGEEVRLTVLVKDRGLRHFTVRTRLAWARRKAARGLPEGFGLDFLSEDAGARDRLVAFAEGHAPTDSHRGQERLGVDLPVSLRHGGRTRRELLADLSTTGAFIQTGQTLVRGTQVEVGFRPPGALRRLKLVARVAWRRAGGELPGMGLRFDFEDDAQAAKVAALVARLGARKKRRA